MLDGPAVEILEKNAVFPSRLNGWDLVGGLLRDILWVYALGHSHYLERIWFQEESESIAAYLFAS